MSTFTPSAISFEGTYGYDEGNTALLDIGSNKAIMSIAGGKVPVFTRGLSIGGNQITERIRDQFTLSYPDAERVKLGDIPGHIPVKDVEEIFISTVQSWVSECKRAIDFYYSNYPDKKIDKLFICGGSSRLPDLARVFHENLDLPVEIFNPLSRLESDAKVFDPEYVDYVGPQMAIALGLALRKTKEI